MIDNKDVLLKTEENGTRPRSELVETEITSSREVWSLTPYVKYTDGVLYSLYERHRSGSGLTLYSCFDIV